MDGRVDDSNKITICLKNRLIYAYYFTSLFKILKKKCEFPLCFTITNNHNSHALFGLYWQLFWPKKAAKTAQKVQVGYDYVMYGETKREAVAGNSNRE